MQNSRHSVLNMKLWVNFTISPVWFARTHSLLRLTQFLLVVLQAPLAHYMLGPMEDDKDSTARDAFTAFFILFLSPCTAIWAAMGWADSKKALPTQTNLYTHPEDRHSGAQNRQKTDIVLVPFWYAAFIATAKCAAASHGSYSMAILMTFSALAMFFVRLNICFMRKDWLTQCRLTCFLLVFEISLHNVRDNSWPKGDITL